MPLEFIPNQPIIFEKPIGDFPCLNNDNKAYAQLLQDGDEMCIQWKLGACDEPMCEPDMVMPTPGSDELGVWTTTGGWTSTGSDNLSFDGTGNSGGNAEQILNGLIIGAVYQLTFNVTSFTGTNEYLFTAGINSSVTINSIGSYTIYFIPINISTNIYVSQTLGSSISSDTLEIANLQAIQWTNCWQENIQFLANSWSYSFDGANGKFCSLDTTGGDLINTTAFTTTGNYHGVELTISDCTAGGLEVRLGSVLLGTTSGNGVFNFYGVPTAGTDLVFTKVDNFDGCVSNVIVNDYGDTSVFNVTLRGLDNSITGTGITTNVFDDRVVACFKPEFLTWSRSRRACELLQVDITEPCTLTIYTSINHIQYIKDGIECTKLVESWNDGYAFGFYFGDVNNPDFVLRQRLRFLAFNPVYKNAGEEYLYSSGNTGRSFAQSQKARTAWFDYMDEYAHDCTRTQLLSQKLLIEGYAFYYPTEDYEPEWNERGAYNLAQSRVTLFHEEAIFGSTCGTMANAVCPPQVIPGPAVQLTQVKLNIDGFDTTGFDITNTNYITFNFDASGTTTGSGSGGPFNLTLLADRNNLATTLAAAIDAVFGTTSSGTITLTGSLLTINITGTTTIPIPMPIVSIALYDGAGLAFSLPITFA